MSFYLASVPTYNFSNYFSDSLKHQLRDQMNQEGKLIEALEKNLFDQVDSFRAFNQNR